MNTIAEEQKKVILDLNSMLAFLNKHFPWIAVEIALSMQVRLGESNPFIAEVFKNVIEDLSRESLDKLVPECGDTGGTSSLDMSSGFSSDEVKKLLAKPAFSLEEEVAEECLPWDHDQSVSIGIGAGTHAEMDKMKVIMQMKSCISKLQYYKEHLAPQADAYSNELKTIEVMLESLDFQM